MKRTSDKLKMSVSSSKTYEQCPRKWHYRYNLHMPQKNAEHLSLGTFVHAVLEDFHNILLQHPAIDLATTMTQRFKFQLEKKKDGSDELEHPLLPESKKKAHEMLATYLKMLRKDGLPKVVENERGFSIDIGDNIIVRGFIDRVDRSDDGVFTIVDYKSGSSKFLDDFQLALYGRALLEQEPDLQMVKGSYVMLKENKVVTYTFTKTDLDRCVAKIRKIATEIREDQTWEPKPSFLCKWCDFEEICPATKNKKPKVADTSWLQAD